MRRRLVLATVLAAVLLLAIAGSAAFAATRSGKSPAPASESDANTTLHGRLVEKVAARLGLDAATVQDAYEQAAKAVEQEARRKLLDQLVESGRLSREQADALNAWLDSRPAALDRLPGIAGFPGIRGIVVPGFKGHHAGVPQKDVFQKMAALLGKDAAAIEQAFKEASQELAKERRTEAINSHLDRLVQDGVITEQEAAALRTWLESAPDFLSGGIPGFIPFNHGPMGVPGAGPCHRFEFRMWPAPVPQQPSNGGFFNDRPWRMQQFGVPQPAPVQPALKGA